MISLCNHEIEANQKENRSKCHVFICMLAYYVQLHMRQKLQSLFEVTVMVLKKYVLGNIMEIRLRQGHL